jgi:hypothetical protein
MLESLVYVIGFLVVSFGFVVFFGAPYVPTLKNDRDKIAKLYRFTPGDIFVDIGSGDGSLLRMAADRHVKAAIGYELNPWLYVISKLMVRKHEKTSIHFANFWQVSLPPGTTVIYAFLNGRYMPRLKRKLENHVKKHHKPLYVISYGFTVPGQKIIKKEGAMYLYKFEPLQT